MIFCPLIKLCEVNKSLIKAQHPWLLLWGRLVKKTNHEQKTNWKFWSEQRIMKITWSCCCLVTPVERRLLYRNGKATHMWRSRIVLMNRCNVSIVSCFKTSKQKYRSHVRYNACISVWRDFFEEHENELRF